jgi:2-polyprenyl-6-methoxyphenol hydroxylase-like FAD-dependent oxidoreductase
MPPFAGEGVNLAFEDVMKLADALRGFIPNRNITLDGALREYEKDAFPRARTAKQLSVGVMEDMLFIPGVRRTVTER